MAGFGPRSHARGPPRGLAMMNLLEITIQRKLGKSWPLVVDVSADRSSLERSISAHLMLDRACLTHLEPRPYGVALGTALFQDKAVRDAFINARARSDEPLHVLLSVE